MHDVIVPFPLPIAGRADAVPPAASATTSQLQSCCCTTFQSAEAVEKLLATGRLVPDPAHAYAD